MDEMTRLFSPSCWVPGKTREENLKNDKTVSREEDIEYGKEENQKIDIWGKVEDKLLIFIHGGYWIEGDRKTCLTPAYCSLNSGFAFASIGYGLAKNGRPLTETVDDVVKGVEFLLMKYPNASKVIIGGHSAGAHLAVQAVSRIRDTRFHGLLLFSGCYFLEELVGTEIGNDINLTPEQAKVNSCNLSELDGLILRNLVILGLQEAPKLIEQNREFAEKRKESKLAEFPESGHYTIMTNLMDETSGEYLAMNNYLKQF
uniref:Abhydrolase_3 domain-containing protein n=1 Tax=Caenorhabditis tropicalis TaxID=1561998 RepID=A0A1I7V0D1_9PELO